MVTQQTEDGSAVQKVAEVIARGRGRRRPPLRENRSMVRDFIRCPYNRKNSISAADDIIQAVLQSEAGQIVTRQIKFKTLTEASEPDWKHTRE